jgi:hypothetical protein
MRTPRPGSALIPRFTFLLFSYCIALTLAGLVAFASVGAQETATSVAPQEYDLKEYQLQLDRCVEAVKTPSEIREFRQSLPSAWHVHAGTTRFEVPTEPIAAELRGLEARPQDAAQIARNLNLRLEAMSKAAAAMEVAEERENPEAARAHLDKILARREFQGAKGPSALDLYLSRISRWIGMRLVKLLMRLHISSRTGNALAWGVMLLAFMALCYMVWRWLSGKPRTAESLPAEKTAPSDARQWVEEALAAAERGEFREAIHCAYWAAVAKLEDLKILARDRARTPRESLRLLEHHPDELRSLRDMTAHFELIWYGYRPASANDWSRAKEQMEKMGCLRTSTAPTANS